jgi:nicotinamidase-related amidase
VLIVIDAQNDFVDRLPDRVGLITRIGALADRLRAAGSPIVWVRTEFAPDLSDTLQEARDRGIRVVIRGTRGAELADGLTPSAADRIVIKKRYSAFFRTELDEIVGAAPRRLVFAGVNTHACVRTSVIDAYQRDHRLIVARDCVGSYDQEHHDVTLRYFDGKIARVLDSAEIA